MERERKRQLVLCILAISFFVLGVILLVVNFTVMANEIAGSFNIDELLNMETFISANSVQLEMLSNFLMVLSGVMFALSLGMVVVVISNKGKEVITKKEEPFGKREQRLALLKEMKEAGEITEKEYKARVFKLIDGE